MKPEMIIRAANGELEGAGALALSANGAEVVLVRAAGDGARLRRPLPASGRLARRGRDRRLFTLRRELIRFQRVLGPLLEIALAN